MENNIVELWPINRDSDIQLLHDLKHACETFRNVSERFTDLQRHLAGAILFECYCKGVTVAEKYAQDVRKARGL